MAAESATVFAVRGQALRVYGWINDSTTGNALDISGGGVTMAANISKDGGAGTATVATPQKVASQTGRFYLELNATEMTAYNAGVVVSCNASNQMESKIDITLLDLAEITGHWLSQSIIKYEKCPLQGTSYLLNPTDRNNSTGIITLYKLDGVTVIGRIATSNNGTLESKGILT